MKKHENAIKMLMKNAIDTKTLYGWYEDDNGARLMTNGHLIIKLSGTTLDYVGDFQKMNDRNDNKRFIDQMNDIVELAKKGEHKTIVNIQDVKAFDRYNTDKKSFCVKYSDNSYIGFNPYYFNKLNILTGSDLITIIDSKSPFYMCGDDIECVLLPVALDKNYNSDNYAVFLEELKACYIQDEETKKEKAAKKANKAAGIIPTLQPNKNYNGFTMSFYGVDYFMFSDAQRITKSIITEFIKAYCKRNNFSDTVLNDMLNSKMQLDNIKARIEKATFILNTNADNSAFTYIDIKTKYAFNGCMYFECDNKLVLIDCVLPTSTETKEETPNNADIVADPETTNETTAADVMSATDTDKAATTDTANNDNVTDTQDIKTTDTTTQAATNNAITAETMQADARQDTRQTETTQDKPQKTNKKAMCLFIVTDKPQPVKLPHLKPLNNIPMFQERFKTDFKPLKNNKGYNTRVKELKPLKKAYNDFVGTVSCYNGKYAMGGDMVAVNSS